MKRKKRYLTGFLFSAPSFFTGAGSVLNLAGSYYRYNTTDSGLEADLRAISNDFGVVGDDIKKALREIQTEEGQLTNN